MTATSPVGTPVSLAQLNASLDEVRAAVVDPQLGIFGPGSLAWRLYGETTVVGLSGPVILLLQSTHPYISHAVAQHSSYRSDPLGRAYRTLDALFTWIFGDLDHVIEAARDIRARHNKVGGQLGNAVGPYEEGHRYTAADSNAILWVHATLWYVPVQVYELLHGPLPLAEKERYYEQTKLFAKLFGLSDEILPPTWQAFCEYFERMVVSNIFTVDKTATLVPKMLFGASHPLLKLPVEQFRLVTIGLLPAPIREAYGWQFGAAERESFEQIMGLVGATARRLPPQVRYFPAYRHARVRVRGKRLPTVTRLYLRAEAGAIRELTQVTNLAPKPKARRKRARRSLLGVRWPRPASLARAAGKEALSTVIQSLNRFITKPGTKRKVAA